MTRLDEAIKELVAAGVDEALRPYLRRLIDPEPLTYTVPQAAVVIGVRAPTVKRLVDEGHLPLVPHMPGRRLIPRAAVEAFVNGSVEVGRARVRGVA